MKKINIWYWTLNILFSAYMLFTAIPYVTDIAKSAEIVTGMLHYPEYIIPFIGYSKIIGCIILLIPFYSRIKEWAYVGLIMDLIIATYSLMAVFADAMTFIIMVLPIIVGALAYYFYYRKLIQERP